MKNSGYESKKLPANDSLMSAAGNKICGGMDGAGFGALVLDCLPVGELGNTVDFGGGGAFLTGF